MIDIALRRTNHNDNDDDNYTTTIIGENSGSDIIGIASGSGGDSPQFIKHSDMDARKNMVHLGSGDHHNMMPPHSYNLSSTPGHQNIFGGSDTIDGKLNNFNRFINRLKL